MINYLDKRVSEINKELGVSTIDAGMAKLREMETKKQ